MGSDKTSLAVRRCVASRTCLLQYLLIQDLHDGGLVGYGGDKLIVHNGNGIVFDTTLHDQVRDTSRVRESWDIAANLVERDREIRGKRARELCLGLVTNNYNG